MFLNKYSSAIAEKSRCRVGI